MFDLFLLDHVFSKEVTNTSLYKQVALPILEGAMAGFNGTVFAYGQTSSGKTHTMMGSHNSPGIVPSVTQDIYNWIEQVCFVL